VGAGVLELDVHTTADGRVVVIHDDVVDRTTDGTGAVREMTLAELKRLDAGYRFTRDRGATFPFRGEGVGIPTLEEVYDEFGDVPINIEIKGERPGIEEALWRIIESAGPRSARSWSPKVRRPSAASVRPPGAGWRRPLRAGSCSPSISWAASV